MIRSSSISIPRRKWKQPRAPSAQTVRGRDSGIRQGLSGESHDAPMNGYRVRAPKTPASRSRDIPVESSHIRTAREDPLNPQGRVTILMSSGRLTILKQQLAHTFPFSHERRVVAAE